MSFGLTFPGGHTWIASCSPQMGTPDRPKYDFTESCSFLESMVDGGLHIRAWITPRLLHHQHKVPPHHGWWPHGHCVMEYHFQFFHFFSTQASPMIPFSWRKETQVTVFWPYLSVQSRSINSTITITIYLPGAGLFCSSCHGYKVTAPDGILLRLEEKCHTARSPVLSVQWFIHSQETELFCGTVRGLHHWLDQST